MRHRNFSEHPEIRDYGGAPLILNINHAANMNENFRTVLWTGDDMQLTLMSIPTGGEIGVEMHTDVDQFIRVESGRAKVYIGNSEGNLKEAAFVEGGYAILIPAGTWHNIVNGGNRPLKLYSLYAPPKHPQGTVVRKKEDEEH